ncbi:MAG: hypothetical protein QW806_10270, partial [Nitrososphaerota archaeon]
MFIFDKSINVHGTFFRVNGTLYKPENIIFKGVANEKYNRYRDRLVKVHNHLIEYIDKIDDNTNFTPYVIINQYFRQNDYHIVLTNDSVTGKVIIKEDGSIEVPDVSNEDLKYNLITSCLSPFTNVSSNTVEVTVLEDLNQILPFYIIFSSHSKYSRLNRQSYSAIRESFDDNIIRFGIEFEIDAEDATDDTYFKKSIKHLISKNNLVFQSDSSVSFGELKTFPLTYDEAVSVLQDFEKLRNLFPQYFKSSGAGMHIHFSCYHPGRQRQNAEVISGTLSTITTNQDFMKFFGRYPNEYAQITDDVDQRRRYINLTNYETIEVRIPTTALSCKSLLDVLEFVKMFSDYTVSCRSNDECQEAAQNLVNFIKQRIQIRSQRLQTISS